MRFVMWMWDRKEPDGPLASNDASVPLPDGSDHDDMSDGDEDFDLDGKERPNGSTRSGKKSSRYPFQDIVDE